MLKKCVLKKLIIIYHNLSFFMELIKTDFDGLFLIKNFNSKDNRGFFKDFQ